LPAIPVSLALAGLDAASLGIAHRSSSPADRGAEVRDLLAWARTQGLRAVQINAATPGVRPRDLDRSARRDLAATLRRHDLECSGLDLWIPPEHFVEPAQIDRAVASVLSAIDLAHDLATLATGSVVTSRPSRAGVVSVLLPAQPAPDALAAIAERALSRGVRLADHAWPPREPTPATDSVAVGLDPAVLLARNEDPCAAASRLGSRIASARLSDVAKGGGGVVGARTPIGARGGGLDPLLYFVSLATAGYPGHAVLDVRGLTHQAAAVQAAIEAIGGDLSAARG
jgi:sugar phosphate isomerase/epimerase